MPVHAARRFSATIVLGLALALALALIAPAASSAHAGHRSATTRLAERTQRQEQRSQRRNARKATREATRTERQSERETRRAARQAERSDVGAIAPLGETASGETPSNEGTSGEGAGGEGQQPAPVKASGTTTPHNGCSITVAASAAQVSVGESVTLTGKLTCPVGVSVEGREVTISQHEAGASGEASSASMASAGTATTAADGSYEFHSAALTGRSTFLVRSVGMRHAARVVVRVGAGVTLEGSAASGAALAMGADRAEGGPNKVSFSGVVEPAAAGTGVGLRVRYAGGEWRTVTIGRTDAEGHYSFSHRFRYAGEVEVATTTRPRGEQRTESTPLKYTIVQAQNPALTIQSSAATPAPQPTTLGAPSLGDPSSAAVTTTISGVASGGANQTVTLLAQGANGHFAPVATVTADATGAYSFTVAPTQTTVYEVSFAKNRSTHVRVIVS